MADKVPGPQVVLGADDRQVAYAFSRLHKRVKRINQQLLGLARVAKTALAGLALGAGLAVREFASFERTMVHVKNLIGATGEEVGKLESLARKLGATTEHTATAAANGLRYFALAGFSASEAIAAIPHALNLATVGELDLARATDLLTDTMTAFGAEAEEAERYVDAFGKASAQSNQSVEQVGAAMEKGAPAARAFGLNVEEASAALGLFANAGSKGEKAGTLLQALVVGFQDNADALREHNIQIYDAAGAYRPLVEVVRDFEAALAGKTDAEKQAIIETLGTTRATRAMRNMLTQGSEAYAQLTREIQNSSGFTERYANELLDTLTGKFRTLISALTEAGLGFTEDILPSLVAFLDKVTALIDRFNQMDKETRKAVSSWIVFAARMSAMVLISATVLRGFGALVIGIRATTIALKAGKFAWRGFWGAATFGLAFAIPLLIEGIIYIRKNWEGAARVMDVAFRAFLIAATFGLAAILPKMIANFRYIRDNWDDILRTMRLAWKKTANFILNEFGALRIQINGFFAAVLEGAALVAEKLPGLGRAIARSLRLAAEQQAFDTALITQGIAERNRVLEEYEARLAALGVARGNLGGGAHTRGRGGEGGDEAESGAGAGVGGAGAKTPKEATAESKRPGWLAGVGWGEFGETDRAKRELKNIEIQEEQNAILTAGLEEATRIKEEAARRDEEAEKRAGEQKASREEAEQTAARGRVEAALRNKLASTKRGSKLLNAWQKVQMLRDIALSVATRAPEAFMTTSAKYPWPLGGVLGALHAASVVAQGSVARGAVAGMREGGMVPGFGRGDKQPAMLEAGEAVLSRGLVDALTRMADGGGSRGGTFTAILQLYGAEVARVTTREDEMR